MIRLYLPGGDGYGWGVCGDNLARAMAALASVERLGHEGPGGDPGGPLLQGIGDAELLPLRPELSGRPHLGYTFFEDDLTARRAAARAATTFDRVVAGSSWCERALREGGCERVSTVLQGVDNALFSPARCGERPDRGRFAVFSGGKLELRKGQDLVLRAFKVLHDRHPDTELVAAWTNRWPAVAASLAEGPWIAGDRAGLRAALGAAAGAAEQRAVMARLVADSGIDPGRVTLLPPLPQSAMAGVYCATDVGLFPNRCEGGTNLVLMENMACGRPAIAADHTGHRDLLTAANSLPIRRARPLVIERGGQPIAHWFEPDLEETVELLETAYRGRDRLVSIGRRAAADMAELTWERAARAFLELLAEG
jgi:glycosyltransferase involved in cell wall biosynthesis